MQRQEHSQNLTSLVGIVCARRYRDQRSICRSLMSNCFAKPTIVFRSHRLVDRLNAASKTGFGVAHLRRALLMPNDSPIGLRM